MSDSTALQREAYVGTASRPGGVGGGRGGPDLVGTSSMVADAGGSSGIYTAEGGGGGGGAGTGGLKGGRASFTENLCRLAKILEGLALEEMKGVAVENKVEALALLLQGMKLLRKALLVSPERGDVLGWSSSCPLRRSFQSMLELSQAAAVQLKPPEATTPLSSTPPQWKAWGEGLELHDAALLGAASPYAIIFEHAMSTTKLAAAELSKGNVRGCQGRLTDALLLLDHLKSEAETHAHTDVSVLEGWSRPIAKMLASIERHNALVN